MQQCSFRTTLLPQVPSDGGAPVGAIGKRSFETRN
jgi:hypothetical protein